MLYCWASVNGEMALVKPSPEKFDIVSVFTVTKGKEENHVAHTAISNGVLYIRNGNALMAYDIKDKG